MKPIVKVTSYYDDMATAAPLARLQAHATVQRIRSPHRLTEVELISALQDATVAIVSDEPFSCRVLDAAPFLGLIGCDGVGVDHIDLQAATNRGILVVNAPVVHKANGDFVMGLIVAVVRKLLIADRGVRAGQWGQRKKYLSRNVHGCTLGLLGFGRVAQCVAQRASGFEMSVIAHSRNPDRDAANKLGITLVTFEELLAQSDILSVHVTLNEQTCGIIGSAELARMKPGAYLINTSRGPVVNEAALVEALATGHLAGAGLDVFDGEPLPVTHPLVVMENVVLTPHVGSDTLDTFAQVFECLVDDIMRYIAGRAPHHVVNREVLSRIPLALPSRP